MIVLDNNVVSELWKPVPSSSAVAWINAQTVETLYLSAVTVAELRFGLATMPGGKRRALYLDRLEREVLPAFAGRVISFDLDASQAYADLMARAKAAGKAIGKMDGFIAATAAVRNLKVATRDTGPFEAAGLQTINPWRVP